MELACTDILKVSQMHFRFSELSSATLPTTTTTPNALIPNTIVIWDTLFNHPCLSKILMPCGPCGALWAKAESDGGMVINFASPLHHFKLSI